MIPLHAQSLRRQILTGTVVLLTLLSVVVVWSSSRTLSERQAEVRAETASMAALSSAYLNQYLDSLDAMAASLVKHPAVIALDRAACDRVFADVLSHQALLSNVVLRARDGAIRGSSLPVPPEAATVMPDYAAQVFATGKSATSALFRGRATNRPAIGRGYPVFGPDGTVIAVLWFGINVLRLQEVLATAALPENSVVTLLDGQGRVIARSLDGERYVGTQLPNVPPIDGPVGGTRRRKGAEGIERFYTDIVIHRGPWILSVGIPSAEVWHRAAPLFRRNAAIALGTVITVMAMSLFLSRHTTRGLNRLRAAAQRIADGDLSPPQPGLAPNFEIQQLQGAFTIMAANLRETRAALDRQIEQERRMREMLESLQLQVVRQERLAAVGLLVSGVAHELNNPLQGILGTVELLERQHELGAEALDEIAFIKTQSGRAREIIRNLSRFSNQQSGPPSLIDLREVVAEVVQLRRRDLEASAIVLDVDAASSRSVLANFTELEQVLLNFTINAQQAIESTSHGRGRILIRLFDAAKRVRLEVHDDGPGVAPDDEAKLFQPFFTTKPVGKGTGLGLSVSYGIIDSYGGSIGHVRNAWGGATFFFELPGAEPHATDDRAATASRAVSQDV